MRLPTLAASVLVAASAMAIAAVEPARAQSGGGGVEMVEVRTATTDEAIVRPGRWLGLNVRLSNSTAEDRRVILRAYPIASQGKVTSPPQSGVAYEREITVPRNGVRDESITVRIERPTKQLVVALEDEDGAVTRKLIAAAPAIPDTVGRGVAVLAIGEGASAFKQMLGLEGPPTAIGPLGIAFHEADPDGLVTDSAGYEPFDVICIADPAPTTLTPARQDALVEWVARGGHLIVSFSGTVGRWKNEPIGAILPQTATGQGTALLAPKRVTVPSPRRMTPDPGSAVSPERERVPDRIDLPTAVGGVVEGAGIVLWSDPVPDETPPEDGGDDDSGDDLPEDLLRESVPLVVTQHWGAGEVTFVAFDVTKARLGRSTVARGLARRVLGTRHGRTIERREGDDAILDLAQDFLIDIPEVRPPPAALVGLLLLIYLGLVGPVGWIVLRGMGRREWIIASAPLCAILFAVLFYLLGLFHRGADALETRFAILTVRAPSTDRPPAGPAGRAETHLGYFVPAKGRYDAAPKGAEEGDARGRVHLTPVGPSSGGLAPRTINAVVRQAGGDYLCRNVQVESSTGRLFVESRTLVDPPISGDLSLSVGGRLVGSLRTGDRPLRNAFLIVGDRHLPLGDVGAGEEVLIERQAQNLVVGSLPEGLVRTLRGRLARQSDSGFADSVGSRIKKELARRLASTTPAPDALPGVIVAETVPGDDDGEILFDPQGARRKGGGLIFCEIDVRLPKGAVKVPMGLAAFRIASASEGYSAADPEYGRPFATLQADNAILYEFRLPVLRARGDRVDGLGISFRLSKPAGKTVIEAWSFDESKWVSRQTGNRGTVALPESAIHPSQGIVWVRIKQISGDGGLGEFFTDETLSLERIEVQCDATRSGR